MLVVAEVSSSEHLGRKNNLAGVLRKVLHYCVNRLKESFLLILHGNFFGKPGLRHSANDFTRLVNRRLEPILQSAGSHAALSGKLGISISNIGLAADA
jgi:hypothetical protein